MADAPNGRNQEGRIQAHYAAKDKLGGLKLPSPLTTKNSNPPGKGDFSSGLRSFPPCHSMCS
jgi:hypothetical protein